MTAKNPPILIGFGEGLFAPLFELIGSVMISASLKVSESVSGSSPWYITAIIAIVILIDFGRNIAIGLTRSQFALGNLIGNILGIILFYGAISAVSSEAATESVLLVIALGGSLATSTYFYLRA